jgi:hypothetical protein
VACWLRWRGFLRGGGVGEGAQCFCACVPRDGSRASGVIALDGKVTLDDNAPYRQDHGRFADPGSADPLEGNGKKLPERNTKFSEVIARSARGTR